MKKEKAIEILQWLVKKIEPQQIPGHLQIQLVQRMTDNPDDLEIAVQALNDILDVPREHTDVLYIASDALKKISK